MRRTKWAELVLLRVTAMLLTLGAGVLTVGGADSHSVERQNRPVLSGEDAAAEPALRFTPPPNVAGQSAWIPLRYQAQEANLCVPTSASIILDYFGDRVSPREIKELSMGRRYSPEKPFHDFTVTLFRDLVWGLQGIGYSWNTKDYPDDRNGLRRGLSDIEHSLDAGIPVMIDTTPVREHTSSVAGHTFVVSGYSVAKQVLYVVDPNLWAPGTRVVGF